MPKYQIKVDGVDGTWGVEADDESQLDAAAEEIRQNHAAKATTPAAPVTAAPMASSHSSLSDRLKAKRAVEAAAPPDEEGDDLGQADPVIPEAPAPKPTPVQPSRPSAPIQRSRFDIPSIPAGGMSILDRIGEALGGSTELPSESVRPGKPLYAGKPVGAKPTTQPAQDILTPLDVATLGPLRRGLLQPAAKIQEAIHQEATGPMIEQPIRRAAETAGNALRGLKIPAADRGMQAPEVGNELGRMPGDIVQGLGNAVGAAASDPIMLAATAAGGGMPALGARALEGMGGYFGVKGAHELTANAIPEAVANYGTATPEERGQIVQNLVEQGVLTASMAPGILHSLFGKHEPLPKIESGGIKDQIDYDVNLGNMWPLTEQEPMPPLKPWQGGETPVAATRRPSVDTRAETAAPWAPALDDTVATPPQSPVGKSNDVLWGGAPASAEPIRRGVRYVRQDDGSFLPGVKRPGPMEVGGSNRGMSYDMNNGPGAPWDPLYDQFARTGTETNPAERTQLDPNMPLKPVANVPWNPRTDPFDRLTADALGNKVSKWQQAITPDASGRVPEDPVGDLLTLVRSEQNSGPGTPERGMYPPLPSSYNTPPKPAPDFEPAPWADLLGDFLRNPEQGGKRFAQQLQQAQGRGGYGPIIDSLESILPPRPPRPPTPADPRRGLKAVPPPEPEPVPGPAADELVAGAGSSPVAAPGDEVGGAVLDGQPAPRLVPERPETLAAQVERGEQGKASAIMIPKGQPVPKRPEGWGRVEVTNGDAPATWFYDKNVYRPTMIRERARTDEGRANLLGKPPKPPAEVPQAVISTKQPDGVPVEDTVVGPETAAATIQDQVAKAAPGEQVVAETPQDTIDQRVAPEKPAAGVEVDDRTDAELKQKLSEVQEKLMFSMGSLNRTPERMAELELLREQDKYYRGELARRRAAAAAPAAPAAPIAPTAPTAPDGTAEPPLMEAKKPGLAERIRGKKKEDAPPVGPASTEPVAAAPPSEVVPWGDEETPVAQGSGTAKTGEAAPAAAKYGSTQVELPAKLSQDVRRLAAKIPDESLAEDGREDRPHVTVKYGLHTDDVAGVGRVLAGEPPVRVKLGATSIFPAAEAGGADVVKVDVDSTDLRRLNKKIADSLPHTDTHPDYVPHVTLAYVKPGEGVKFAGDKSLVGRETVIDRITFSTKDGVEHEIKLDGQVPSQPPPSEAVESQPADKSTTPAPPIEPALVPPVGDMTKAEGGGATSTVEDLGPSGLKMDEIARAASRLNIPLPSRESLRDPVDAVIARAKHDFEGISRAMHSKEKVELRPELTREEAYVGLSQFRDLTDKKLPQLTEELERAHASGDQAAIKAKQDQIDGTMLNAAALADRLYRGGSEAGRRLAFQKIMAPDASDVIDPLLAIKKGQQLTGGKLTPDMQNWIIEQSAKAQRTRAAIVERMQKRSAEAMERLSDPKRREQLKEFDPKKLEGCE